jgi:hypothetical protein
MMNELFSLPVPARFGQQVPPAGRLLPAPRPRARRAAALRLLPLAVPWALTVTLSHGHGDRGCRRSLAVPGGRRRRRGRCDTVAAGSGSRDAGSAWPQPGSASLAA